ncbi:hypothetical protein BKD26_38785, partial [Streptomyces sp. CB03238]
VTVSVPAGAEGGCAVLVVENDGVDGGAGVGAEAGAGGGFGSGAGGGSGAGAGSGLAGLRERLAALDGTLEAGWVSGGRFRVTARVPVGASGTGSAGAAVAEAAW